MPILTYERPPASRFDASSLLEVDRRSLDYARWIQTSVNRVTGAGLRVDGIIGDLTRAAVRAFQSGRRLVPDGVVGPLTEAALIAAGAGPPPGTGTGTSPSPPSSTLPFPLVITPLPTTGPGYLSYSSTSKQYGLRETILAVQRIAARWQAAHSLGPRLGIGDISVRGGGDIDGHDSHELGVDVDIRPLRNDGADGVTSGAVKYQDATYSRALTQELATLIRSNGVLAVEFILFNDPELIKQGLVRPWSGHDNHLHVRFFALSAASREAQTDRAVDRQSRDYLRWVQTSLNRLTGTGIAVDGLLGDRTRAAVRAFQTRHRLPADGLVGERTEAAMIAAGANPPPSTALPPLSSRPHPEVNTPLPRVAPGLYSRKPTAQQYGLPETIRALQGVGERWYSAHATGPRIAIGDISLRGGGDIAGHASHERGVDVDVWLVRNDGREDYVTYKAPEYSRPLTRELVNLIRSNGVLRVQYVFFNDPELIKAGLTKSWPGHDNHLHVRFFPPGGSARAKESDFEVDGYARESAVDRRNPSYARWVQTSLNGVMGTGVPVDGTFGSRTQAAVKAFQSSRGLAADGVMGPRTEASLVAAGAGPPPGATSAPVATGVPAVINRETDPARGTLYLNIPLGGEAPAGAETGVFVPVNFRPTPRVDLIVYLHGFKRYGPSISIAGYWNKQRFPHHALREGVNVSGKNVILVAPTLGPRSQAGRLVGPGGFDQYVDRVLAAIGQHVYGGSGPTPQLGALIVASHSGGGLPMRQVVIGSRKYAANIRECWGFDCMYGGPSEARQWAQWAASQQTRSLFVYFTDTGGTRGNSSELKDLAIPNVHVERTAAPHDRVQITHWLTRLSAASFLAIR